MKFHSKSAPLLALGLLTLAGSPIATAATHFSNPLDISSTSDNSAYARIAADPAGNAIAVWQAYDGTINRIWGAMRPAGGTFGAPVALSGSGTSAYAPQIAFDAAGNALAVWTRSDGHEALVEAAYRPAGGAFAPATVLSAAGEGGYVPQVAFDSSGDALVVWQNTNSTTTVTVVQAAFRPAGGTFGAPVNVSRSIVGAFPNEFESPNVAFDQAGNALVVWRQTNAAKNYVVQAAFRAAGSGFDAPVNLSDSLATAAGPQVAFDPSGNAIAIWSQSVPDSVESKNHVVQAAIRPAGGAFGKSIGVSPTEYQAGGPQIAFDSLGNSIVAWDYFDQLSHVNVVQASLRRAGNAFGAPVTLSAPSLNAVSPLVAFDRSDNATVMWDGYDGGSSTLQAATSPSGGPFGAPLNVSAPGAYAFDPDFALDPAGNVIAVWERFSNGSNGVIQASSSSSDATSGDTTSGDTTGSGTAGSPPASGESTHGGSFDWLSLIVLTLLRTRRRFTPRALRSACSSRLPRRT